MKVLCWISSTKPTKVLHFFFAAHSTQTDASEGRIGPDGVAALCNDLQISIESITGLSPTCEHVTMCLQNTSSCTGVAAWGC